MKEKQPKYIQKMIDLIDDRDNELIMFIDSERCDEYDLDENEFLYANGGEIKFSNIQESDMDSLVLFYDIKEQPFEDDINEYIKIVRKSIKEVDKAKNKLILSLDDDYVITEEQLKEFLSMEFIYDNYNNIKINDATLMKFDKIKVENKIDNSIIPSM